MHPKASFGRTGGERYGVAAVGAEIEKGSR